MDRLVPAGGSLSGRRAWGQGAHRGAPHGYEDWYDWALVYRYWNRDAAGLRMPYLLERAALLALGDAEGLATDELAERLCVSARTIERWRSVAKRPGSVTRQRS